MDIIESDNFWVVGSWLLCGGNKGTDSHSILFYSTILIRLFVENNKTL